MSQEHCEGVQMERRDAEHDPLTEVCPAGLEHLPLSESGAGRELVRTRRVSACKRAAASTTSSARACTSSRSDGPARLTWRTAVRSELAISAPFAIPFSYLGWGRENSLVARRIAAACVMVASSSP